MIQVKLKFKEPNDFYQLFRKIEPDGTTIITFKKVDAVEVGTYEV